MAETVIEFRSNDCPVNRANKHVKIHRGRVTASTAAFDQALISTEQDTRM